jgi:glutamate carboxypeptidase
VNGKSEARAVEYFAQNLPLMIQDLKDLVECESPSGNTGLLNACADKVTEIIVKRTNQRPTSTQLKDGSRILSFSVGGKEEKGNILVLCHYDTVFPVGAIKINPFSTDGGKAKGPGVLDMKAGIVQGVWAVRFLVDNNLSASKITLIFTPDEETGSMLSREFIEDAGRNSELVIVLEPSENGKIKTGRKGVGTYDIAITGRASHAGLHPEEGINAIAEIAGIIVRISGIQDLAKGTTINVGTISGGTATNVVPDHAYIGVDVRVSSMTEAKRVDDAFRNLKPSNLEAKISVSGGINRLPMIKNDKTQAVMEVVREVGKTIGLVIDDVSVGGGSDANILAPFGMAILDGMGAVGSGAHSSSEYVDILSIPSRTALLAIVLAKFSGGKTIT